jgi:hypothetical protein
VSVRKFTSASISSAVIKSSKLWDQETFPGTFESISTAIVDSSGASTITFSNIPQNYKHLQIRYIGRGSSGTVYSRLRFNSDTSTNYYTHELYGGGSGSLGAQAYSGSSFNAIVLSGQGFTSASSTFNGGIVDILDYTSTSKNKTVKILEGFDANGSGALGFYSGLWSATPAAITTIEIIISSGTFSQYSHFALYGIRGA